LCCGCDGCRSCRRSSSTGSIETRRPGPGGEHQAGFDFDAEIRKDAGQGSGRTVLVLDGRQGRGSRCDAMRYDAMRCDVRCDGREEGIGAKRDIAHQFLPCPYASSSPEHSLTPSFKQTLSCTPTRPVCTGEATATVTNNSNHGGDNGDKQVRDGVVVVHNSMGGLRWVYCRVVLMRRCESVGMCRCPVGLDRSRV
jgi:hypothetical protein